MKKDYNKEMEKRRIEKAHVPPESISQIEEMSSREKKNCTEVIKIVRREKHFPRIDIVLNELEEKGIANQTSFRNEAEMYNVLTHFLEVFYGEQYIKEQIGTFPGWNDVKRWIYKASFEIEL